MENDNLELMTQQTDDLLSKFYQLRIQQIMLSFNLEELRKTTKELNSLLTKNIEEQGRLT